MVFGGEAVGESLGPAPGERLGRRWGPAARPTAALGPGEKEPGGRRGGRAKGGRLGRAVDTGLVTPMAAGFSLLSPFGFPIPSASHLRWQVPLPCSGVLLAFPVSRLFSLSCP